MNSKTIAGPAKVPVASTSFNWQAAAPIIALVALVVVFTVLNPNFLSAYNASNLMRQSSVLLVLAVASTFIILMGSIDLSIGSIVTLSATIGALLFEKYGPVGLIAVPLVGLICGVFNGVLFAYARLPSFLVTLGTLFMFDGFSLILSDGRPRPVSTRTFDTAFNGTLFGFLPIVTLWAVAILLLAIFIASRTRFGRYLYAIGGGEKVARLSGVAIERQKFLAFVLSGFLGGFAALLLIFRLQAATTGMGASYLLTSIAAVVIGGTSLSGGVGGPQKTLIGVLVIAILTNGMDVVSVQPFLQTVIMGAVVILAVGLTINRASLSLIK